MRASPAFQVTIVRFGAWRAAVYTLSTCSAACAIAWLATGERPVFIPALIFAVAASVSAIAIGVSLGRVMPAHLRWDGQQWFLGAPAIKADEHAGGTLSVALDLGAWMLLRFVPHIAAGPVHDRWLPVQRRGLEAQWHALRCAVYSPRPIADDGVPAGPGSRE